MFAVYVFIGKVSLGAMQSDGKLGKKDHFFPERWQAEEMAYKCRGWAEEMGVQIEIGIVPQDWFILTGQG